MELTCCSVTLLDDSIAATTNQIEPKECSRPSLMDCTCSTERQEVVERQKTCLACNCENADVGRVDYHA